MRSGVAEGIRGAFSKHPIAMVFVVALAARVLLAVTVYVTNGGILFGDDLAYSRLASAVTDNATYNWDQYTEYLYEGTATFTYPLTWLYQLSGSREIAGQLFVAVAGAGTVAVVARLALLMMPALWAALTGLMVALLPSQVLWSSLILKDAFVWLILAAIALLVAVANRRSGRDLWLALVGITLLLLAMGRLREQTLVVSTWALVLASLFGTAVPRGQRLFACLSIALVIPWVTGFGPMGLDFVRSTGSLEQRRTLNAEGAESAFVDELPEGSVGGDPGNDTSGDLGGDPGNDTSGSGSGVEPSGGVSADLKHLPRGLSVMLLEPFPWQRATSDYYKWAKLEIVFWYPLLGLALLGLRPAFRRLKVMAFPLFAGAGMLAVYALAEGNLGTAVRHRGEFVWVVALLAGLGAWAFFERRHDAASLG